MEPRPATVAPDTDPRRAGEEQRIRDVQRLLAVAPFGPQDRVLDVGMGNGAIARALAPRVRQVIGTGLAMSSYGTDPRALAAERIAPVECLLEQLPFGDGQFDALVLSHVLEHCPNVGLALAEARRVLTGQGLLCVFVPPHEPKVCGGHVAVGWNLGQLMYVLAVSGYDAARGHFACLGSNIGAFVRKDPRPVPPLRGDFGDLRTLAAAGRFPLPIVNDDPHYEAFLGDLLAVNWPWTELFGAALAAEPSPAAARSARARWLRRLVPGPFRPGLVRLGRGLIWALHDPPPAPPARELINPPTLHL